MRRLKRTLGIAILCSVGVWLASVGALAAKPDRQSPPPPADFTVNFCGPAVGPINVHTDWNQHQTTFFEKDGTVRLGFNGWIQTTLTTTAGKTLVLNTSGPGTITIGPNGVTVVGRGPGLVGDSTGIKLYDGRVVLDPNTFMVVSYTGHVTDICQLLM